MATITNRVLLLNEYFRLVDADATDGDMIEHDDTTLEGAYQMLQAGMWDAQQYLIDSGVGSRWAKTTSALTFSGSDPAKYVALPSDFLRLDSDHNRSGLRYSTGISWGREVPFSMRFRYTGNGFYIRGNEAESGKEGQLRLYLTRSAAPPVGLVGDYFYKHATLSDSTTLDFPEEDRGLVSAFAAQMASFQVWFSGGQERKKDIADNLAYHKQQAWRRSRYTRQPKMVAPHALIGDHWY